MLSVSSRLRSAPGGGAEQRVEVDIRAPSDASVAWVLLDGGTVVAL